MQNRKIFIIGALFILFVGLLCNVSMAKNLDLINQYYVTLTPRRDGTVDIIYDFEWEVLDSKSEGPLEWVKIGIPNSNVSNIRALTGNISKIGYLKDHGTYVRIDFDRPYNKGEVVKFKFKIHQGNMFELKDNKVVYNFTPGWFPNIHVEDARVLWSANGISEANTQKKESNYYVWKKSLKSDDKIKTKVEYPREYFTILDMNQEKTAIKYANDDGEVSNYAKIEYAIVAFFILIMILSILMSVIMPGSYRSHRGFGYGGYGSVYGRSSYRSHCACVSSCACACACAGGGRAGCSRKDFYGTRLKSSSLNKVLNKDEKKNKK